MPNVLFFSILTILAGASVAVQQVLRKPARGPELGLLVGGCVLNRR
jgi:hypothetical protein